VVEEEEVAEEGAEVEAVEEEEEEEEEHHQWHNKLYNLLQRQQTLKLWELILLSSQGIEMTQTTLFLKWKNTYSSMMT